MAFEFEIAIPRHRRQPTMEERMRIVAKTGQTRIFDGHQSTARNGSAIQRDRFEPATCQISLQDQCIVARAENNSVVTHCAIAWRSNREGSNKGLTPNGAALTEPKSTRPF